MSRTRSHVDAKFENVDERVTAQRRFGAIRTLLIGYGVAAFGYLLTQTQTVPRDDSLPLTFVTVGVALQLVLLAAGLLVRRYIPDVRASAQSMFVLELIGDGVTVLFFALATLRAVMPPSLAA